METVWENLFLSQVVDTNSSSWLTLSLAVSVLTIMWVQLTSPIYEIKTGYWKMVHLGS